VPKSFNVYDLDDLGLPGPRWSGEEPATLERVLFHLVLEYARHLGHLDIYAGVDRRSRSANNRAAALPDRGRSDPSPTSGSNAKMTG